MQYKLSKGGEVIRTDIQVGDDTLPFFSVSLWKKQMGTMVVAGDILLLQSKQGHRFLQFASIFIIYTRLIGDCVSALLILYRWEISLISLEFRSIFR
jgi:hypothetical protein